MTTVRQAMEALLSVCDGAHKLDAQGFNGMDSRFARDLSTKARWSQKQEAAILKMLRKYRKQLSKSFGISYDTLTLEVQTTPVVAQKRLFLHKETNFLAFQFPFDATLKDTIKFQLVGTWESQDRVWLVSQKRMEQALELATQHDFEVSGELGGHLDIFWSNKAGQHEAAQEAQVYLTNPV